MNMFLARMKKFSIILRRIRSFLKLNVTYFEMRKKLKRAPVIYLIIQRYRNYN